MLENKWSHFNEDGSELIITNQRTPFDWNNFFFTKDGLFRMEVDQCGRGNIYYNYDQNLVSKGRFLLVRDENGFMSSLTGNEAPNKAKKSQCIQKVGCSIFETETDVFKSQVTIMLDSNKYREYTKVELVNTTSKTQTLELTAGHFIKIAGGDNGSQLDHTEYHPELRAMAMRRYHSECPPNGYSAYYLSDLIPDSVCGSLDDFYGGNVPFAEAAAIQDAGKLPEGQACATPPVFALRYNIELKAGESKKIYFELGIANYLEESLALASQYDSNKIQEAMQETQKFYAEALAGSKIKTPETNLNFCYNVWTRLQLFHQNLNGRNWNIYIWRNHLQDGSGLLQFDTSYGRNWIKQLCSLAQADGFVPRTTAKGTNIPAHMKFYFKQRHNDIGSWLGMSVAEYCMETGDLDFLQEKIFNEAQQKELTILDVVEAGLIWTLSQRGLNGFIRFLDGDWSDPLEKAGRRGIGESCWTAMAIVRAVKMFAPIMRTAGFAERAERLEKGSAEVADALNRNGWDGKWYIRGITDDGVHFCTEKDKDAKISMLVQAWAVLAGVASPERQEIIMREAGERCMTEFGPMLYGPPYMTEREGIGRESAKRPGCGENGSCYTHGSMMFAAARLMSGDVDGGLDVIQKTVPLSPVDCYSVRWSSPLWWCNYYQAPCGSKPGRSSNFTSSGGPSWFVMNMAQRIFGLVPQLDGLHIEPNFPSTWNEGEIERLWRGSVYKVSVKRTGKNQVTLDGKVLEKPILPIPTEKGTHEVLVEIK